MSAGWPSLAEQARAHIRERGTVRSDVLARLLDTQGKHVVEALVGDVKAGELIACEVRRHGASPVWEYRLPAAKLQPFTPMKPPGAAPVRPAARVAAPGDGVRETAPTGPIERGVPIPRKTGGRKSVLRDLLLACSPGDSFTTSLKKPSVYSAAKTAGVAVIVRTAGEGRVRVWRAE